MTIAFCGFVLAVVACAFFYGALYAWLAYRCYREDTRRSQLGPATEGKIR